MTRPAAMVGLGDDVTAPSVSPTAVRALFAAASVRPATSGTRAYGPDDTTSATGDPIGAKVPAGGSSLMTLPCAMSALAIVVTVPTTSFASVIADAAASFVRFTT